MRAWQLVAAVAAAAVGVGCGATVGDACTVPADCGDRLCIQRDYTPGGYCSMQCVLSDRSTCPAGSVCIDEGAGGNINACFRECDSDGDCRAGYVCRAIRNNPIRVCVGPSGI
jgi:hypothetical protein